MQALIDFFTTIPSAYRTAILVSGLLIFWIWEGLIPLFGFKYNKIRHAGINLFFTFTTLLINLAFAFLIVKISDYMSGHQMGLLYIWALPLSARIILGLLLLDFIGAWLVHWTEHKIKWMWRFHIIHHTDRQIDVTSALRHHPGESIFRALFTLLAIVVSGAPMGIVMLYQTLSALLSQFNHANIHLPAPVDRFLTLFIVSPDMHKVHHHYKLPLTDSNYGNIFSFWDRLFGCYIRVKNVKDELIYGIDTHMDKEDTEIIKNLLLIPFRPDNIQKTASGKT